MGFAYLIKGEIEFTNNLPIDLRKFVIKYIEDELGVSVIKDNLNSIREYIFNKLPLAFSDLNFKNNITLDEVKDKINKVVEEVIKEYEKNLNSCNTYSLFEIYWSGYIDPEDDPEKVIKNTDLFVKNGYITVTVIEEFSDSFYHSYEYKGEYDWKDVLKEFAEEEPDKVLKTFVLCYKKISKTTLKEMLTVIKNVNKELYKRILKII